MPLRVLLVPLGARAAHVVPLGPVGMTQVLKQRLTLYRDGRKARHVTPPYNQLEKDRDGRQHGRNEGTAAEPKADGHVH